MITERYHPTKPLRLLSIACRWLWLVVWLAAVWVNRAASTATDDSYFAQIWQAEDGLPENRVVGIAQSGDGFLWVATQGSLVRFDGVTFQKVSLSSAPESIAGTMRALLLDRAGRIWLAKEEEDTLFCFDGAAVRTVTSKQGLPKNERQSSMAVDGEGNLWISYSSGKVVRYHGDGQVDLFTTKDGLPGGGGSCWLACGRDGVLWFAKGRQLGVFRGNRFNVLENFGSAALRIAPSRSGGVWVCAGGAVMKYDQGVETLELGRIDPPPPHDQSGLEPSVLLEDHNGIVWVGTVSSGLYRCESNQITRIEVSNPYILCLTEDREGNLWVGTRGGGLNRLHRRVTSLIKSTDGLPFECVQSICQDASGSRWVVGDNGLLVRRQDHQWTSPLPNEKPGEIYVTCVAASSNGPVWIGTRGGDLYRWQSGELTNVGVRGLLLGKSIRSLLATRGGDLWFATDSSDMLYRLRDGAVKAFNLPTGYRFIRALTEDAKGNIWAGASDGLLVRVTGDELSDETATSSKLSIRCLYGAPDGDLWIGYAGAGVGRYRDGRIIRFSTEHGLLNDYVSQILEDGSGGLWFAGNQGVFQVRKRDFEDVATGISARVWPMIYGRSEGMRGLQASFDYCPSSLRAGLGRLYFSMLSGLAEVRLDNARLNYHQPSVLIYRVVADDRIFAAYQNFYPANNTNHPAGLELCGRTSATELRLPPGLQQVQFEFTALSFVAPENVQFRYQLEGLDENWVDAGVRRVASYTHLPPGSYRFKVIACNNDGIWNRTGDALSVVVGAFFWETLWFKILLGLSGLIALCATVVLILRRRHRRELERLERQRALEEERNRIARDLHDDLGVGLTEIGLLGDLAGGDSQIPATSRQRLDEITDRARGLVGALDEIVWAINPTNDSSQSLMDYVFPYAQKLLGRAGIRCRLQVTEPLPTGKLNAERRHEFFHAYKEALNNVIRHSKATQVVISLSAAGNDLLIRVADNGRGLDGNSTETSHHGLSGMRDRLQRLGGRCEISATEGGGTTVTFTLPVQPNV